MDHRTKKLLFDVVASGRSILEWCHGRSFADYERDRQFRRAVEREFEVIGEALNRLVRSDPAVAERISRISRIISFRNVLIHGYDLVDHEVVWDVVETQLPLLREQVQALLAEGEE